MRKNIFRKNLAIANDNVKEQVYKVPFEKGERIGYTNIELKPDLVNNNQDIAMMQSDTGCKVFICKPNAQSIAENSNDFLFQ